MLSSMKRPERIQKDFGLRVREVRLEKGLSQEELAFEAGLDRTYVNSVENGKRNISLVNIVRLAEALEIPTSDLFKS
jgi:transcriptional regulator with XRE-family HTH domain